MASEALRRLYEADQAARLKLPIDWNILSGQDRERRAEVRRLLARGNIRDGWDYYWAAVVLIHSHEAVDLEEAFELSRRAVELEPNSVQILAFHALAKDRQLLSQGEPQWYGTQKLLVEGRVVLAPIDPAAVTDRERSSMGVLTLADRYREIEFINDRRKKLGQ